MIQTPNYRTTKQKAKCISHTSFIENNLKQTEVILKGTLNNRKQPRSEHIDFVLYFKLYNKY